MAAPLDLAAFLVLAGLAGLGAWLDLRHRLLPNWLCALTLLAGLAFAFAQGGWPAVASGGGHALAALAVGMGLFALGAIGGGDAKFYSALAAWFVIEEGFRLLFSVSLAGLLLALLFWRGRKLARPSGSDAGSGSHHDMVPYGVAIAAGAVVRKAALLLA